MQALMSDSGQYVKSRDTYLEVRSRHEEIKRLERYMTELATLANDTLKRYEARSCVYRAGSCFGTFST
ncbi:syntaxin-like protein [Moniliophthora roreri]|nr:syntaxin-like protein [Moniliophthora roreri]